MNMMMAFVARIRVCFFDVYDVRHGMLRRGLRRDEEGET
jgi:hypothetical protein